MRCCKVISVNSPTLIPLFVIESAVRSLIEASPAMVKSPSVLTVDPRLELLAIPAPAKSPLITISPYSVDDAAYVMKVNRVHYVALPFLCYTCSTTKDIARSSTAAAAAAGRTRSTTATAVVTSTPPPPSRPLHHQLHLDLKNQQFHDFDFRTLPASRLCSPPPPVA